MKRILLLLAAVLLAVLAFNTSRYSHPAAKAAAVTLPPVDADALAQRLAAAVRIPTVSHALHADDDPKQLEAFADFLEKTYPRMHAMLKREVVNGHGLLYTWTGKDAKAAPVLLLAHQDVVPVEPGTESAWAHAPFSGDIADGYIWGRGTLDDKGNVLGMCEAVEALLAQNFVPARTVLLAFGSDEEVGGHQGAGAIAALLKSRGAHFAWSLDEGGAVTSGVVAGVSAPVASIMTAEKGFASFSLSTHDDGGHSSRPPKVTAIGRLARAVSRVQEQLMPARLAPPVSGMLDAVAPEMPVASRIGIANRWLLGPLVTRKMESQPLTDALVRTTTAPTMFNAGVKDNVLPSEAHAVINFRLLPGDTIAIVQAHIRDVVADGQVEVKLYGNGNNDPSPVSDQNAAGFALLARTVNQVYPDAVVTPGLMIAATDTRNYAGLFDNRYNFSPVNLVDADVKRIHGKDERIAVADYARGVQWYMQLLTNLQ